MKLLLKDILLIASVMFAVSLWASSSGNPVISLPGIFLNVLCAVYLVGGMAFYLGAVNTDKLRAFLVRYGYLKLSRISLLTRFASITLTLIGAMLAFVFSFYWFSQGSPSQIYFAVSSMCVFIALSQLAKALLLGFTEMPTIKGQVISFGIGALVMGVLPSVLG